MNKEVEKIRKKILEAEEALASPDGVDLVKKCRTMLDDYFAKIEIETL